MDTHLYQRLFALSEQRTTNEDDRLTSRQLWAGALPHTFPSESCCDPPFGGKRCI